MHTIRKRSRNSASIGVTAALLFLLSVPVVAKAEGNMKSLYERLGGYGAISAVVNDFAGKLFTDPEVGAFFKGMGTDTRESFIQKNINLVCNVTGGRPHRDLAPMNKDAEGRWKVGRSYIKLKMRAVTSRVGRARLLADLPKPFTRGWASRKTTSTSL